MKLSELEAKIEAILFTMGEAVELERIAAATEQDEDTCRKVIRSMMDNYAAEDRGIQIIELDGAFQMCTKADMYEAIVRIAHVPKKHVLTDVLLETLSIIAYKQPITKVEIEHIRGVKSAPAEVLGAPRRGLSMVFSGDTAPCAALEQAARDADLLLCDATYPDDAQQAQAKQYGHSTFRQDAELAARAGA